MTDVNCTLSDLDASSRQLLEDIQTEAGVATMHDNYAIEEYSHMLTDTYDPDDSWLEADNEDTPSPETTNLMQAARDLRFQSYVFLFYHYQLSQMIELGMYRLKGRRRIDHRTWKGRRQRELHAWDSILERMADAYMQWKDTEAGAYPPLVLAVCAVQQPCLTDPQLSIIPAYTSLHSLSPSNRFCGRC